MKHKVTVYGSLLNGLGNHGLLERHNAKLLGEFKTKPNFTMLSLGGFPGVIKNGNTAIHAEVYEVDDNCLNSLDGLEGFQEGREHNFYNRENIETPFGESFIYFYNYAPRQADIISNVIKSGNWKKQKHE